MILLFYLWIKGPQIGSDMPSALGLVYEQMQSKPRVTKLGFTWLHLAWVIFPLTITDLGDIQYGGRRKPKTVQFKPSTKIHIFEWDQLVDPFQTCKKQIQTKVCNFFQEHTLLSILGGQV